MLILILILMEIPSLSQTNSIQVRCWLQMPNQSQVFTVSGWAKGPAKIWVERAELLSSQFLVSLTYSHRLSFLPVLGGFFVCLYVLVNLFRIEVHWYRLYHITQYVKSANSWFDGQMTKFLRADGLPSVVLRRANNFPFPEEICTVGYTLWEYCSIAMKKPDFG